MTLTVPCLFGLESLVADEMRRLDLKNVQAENGRVHCEGTLADIARLNINLRCGARVLMELGSFPARDFEALFQGVYALPWENYIPRDGEFPVKGLFPELPAPLGPRLPVHREKGVGQAAGGEVRRGDPAGDRQPVSDPVFHHQGCSDLVCWTPLARAFTSGATGLRTWVPPCGRRWRQRMVTLSRYRGKDPFCDPFCGSGTIPIEAALIAKNRAPGLDRSFAAQKWN